MVLLLVLVLCTACVLLYRVLPVYYQHSVLHAFYSPYYRRTHATQDTTARVIVLALLHAYQYCCSRQVHLTVRTVDRLCVDSEPCKQQMHSQTGNILTPYHALRQRFSKRASYIMDGWHFTRWYKTLLSNQPNEITQDEYFRVAVEGQDLHLGH